MKLKKVMFISSSGGHFNELMQLEELIAKYNSIIITENSKNKKSLKKQYKNIKFLLFGTKHNMILYPFVLFINCWISLYYYICFRPKVIITTGVHTAGPMCLIGKIFGAKIIYIESFACISSKTVTGKLLYPISNLFIVQWENMKELYPKAIYGGGIFK